MSTTQHHDDDEDTFWRKLVLPQEDRMRLGIPWHGGYRWFRSPNVVCLEQWRRKRDSQVTPSGWRRWDLTARR